MSSRNIPSNVVAGISFNLGKELGRGGQGTVHLAERTDGMKPLQIAVKCVPLRSSRRQYQKDTEALDKMAPILLGLGHLNIAYHLGFQLQKTWSQSRTGLIESVCYMSVMEYCAGGTLEKAGEKQNIELDKFQRWLTGILNGLDYLHDLKIIHRDIKNENIFLSDADHQKAVAKIGDLGSYRQLVHTFTQPGEITSVTGTYCYMAPEVHNKGEKQDIGRRSDIWSLGCTVIHMITGCPPTFVQDGRKLRAQYEIIQYVAKGGRPEIPSNLPLELDDFIKKCLAFVPQDRPCASKLLGHPFLKSNVSQMTLPARIEPSEYSDISYIIENIYSRGDDD